MKLRRILTLCGAGLLILLFVLALVLAWEGIQTIFLKKKAAK